MRLLKPPTATRAQLWTGLAAIVVVAAALLWTSIENYRVYFGLYHDDAIYMVCSRALAEGHGYKIISLPGDPPQTKYPVGFPLMLSIVWRLCPSFPDNLPAFEAVQVIFAAAAALVAAGYLIATRKVTVVLGLAILGACLFNRRYIDCAPMVMSDLPCAFMAYLCLWRAEIEGKRPFRWRGALFLGLLLTATGFLRAQGLAALISCVAYLVLKKRFRLAAVALTLPLVAFAPAVFWGFSQYQRVPDVLSFYTGYVSPAGEKPPTLAEAIPIARSLYEAALFNQTNTYFPFLSDIPFWILSPLDFTLIYRVGFTALQLLLVAGLFREVGRLSLPGIYVLVCLVPACLFPVRLEWRYIVPLLPFTYYLYFCGFRLIGRWAKPAFRRMRGQYRRWCAVLAVALSAYLVAGALYQSTEMAFRYQKGIRERAPRFSPQAGNSDYYETFLWIKAHTDDNHAFVCNNDPLLFLYTGRKAVYPLPIDFWSIAKQKPLESDSVMRVIRYARPRYLMVDPFFRGIGHTVSPAEVTLWYLLGEHPEAIAPVFTSSHNLIRIFRLDTEKLLGDAPTPGI